MSDSRSPKQPDRSTWRRKDNLPPPPRIALEDLSIDELPARRQLPTTAERETRRRAAYVPAPESTPVAPPVAPSPAAPTVPTAAPARVVAAKAATPPQRDRRPEAEVPAPKPPPVTRTRIHLEEARQLDQAESWVDALPLPLQHVHQRPLLLIPICAVLLAIIWAMLSPADQQRLSGYVHQAAAVIVPPDPKQADLTQYVNPAEDGEHSLLGPPTISAATIDQVLASYGSPAVGTGQIWVDLGMQYGLDPAYALAFFIHESGAGTASGWAGLKSDGSTTHNIGNIICAGYATCYGRFRDYPDWRTGIEDWYRLIAIEYVQWRGVHTVEQIIPIYAPAFENDVSGYVNVVERLVNEWRAEERR